VADIETLENFYVRAVAPPVVAFVVTLGMSLFAGLYHPSLAYILASGLLVGGTLVPVIARMLARQPGRDAIEQRAQLRAAVIDSIQGMPDLASNNRSEQCISKILSSFSKVMGFVANNIWRG
jgi:ABC-type transport system involved in cytochrome bd biosynthesis fused ATPase/permease subunit